MARSSFLSSTRRSGSISFVCSTDKPQRRGRYQHMCGDMQRQLLLARPAWIAVGPAKGVFCIAPLLFQVCNLFLLSFDLRCLLVYFLAGILLLHCLGGIRIILNAVLVFFALEYVEFLFGGGNFCAQIGEAGAPSLFGIGVRGLRRVGRVGCQRYRSGLCSVRCGLSGGRWSGGRSDNGDIRFLSADV